MPPPAALLRSASLPGALTLVRAEIKTADALADPNLGWRNLALGPFERFDVSGDHITMMSEPCIVQWAGLLEARMTEARQKWTAHQQGPNHVSRLQSLMEAHQQHEEVAALTKARGAAKTGDLAAEISHYRRALLLQPQQPHWVYRNLAHAYWQKGQTGPALDALRQAISRESVPIAGYHLLANWLRQLGRHAEHQRCLNEAAQCAPDTLHGQCALGQLMLQHGRQGPAEVCFRNAVALQAEHFPALFPLSALLGSQGHHKEALAIAARLVADRPNSPVRLLRYAQLLAAQGRTAEAMDAALQTVALKPKSLPLLHHLATILASTGQMQAAIETCQDVARRLPGSPNGPDYLRRFWARRLGFRLSQWLGHGPLAGWELRLIALLATNPALVRCYLRWLTSLSAPHVD